MRMWDCIERCVAAGATVAYCTRLTETWLLVHVDLPGIDERMALGKALRPLYGEKKRVTIAVAEAWPDDAPIGESQPAIPAGGKAA